MRKRSNAFAHAVVGFFMVALVALLGYFTIVVSGVDLLSGRSRRPVRVEFEQVAGLKEHDSVMYRGTKVGTVEQIAVTPSNLVVTAVVDERVVLRRGCRAAVCSLSVLGGNYLLLEEGSGDPLDPADAAPIRGETPTDWMGDVARIARNLRELTDRLEGTGIVTNLESASESMRNVFARIDRGEGLVGKLVSSDDKVYDDLKAAVASAREITSQLNRRSIYENLDSTLANAKSITERLNRQKLYDELDAAIADFRKTCGSITAASEGLDLKGVVARADSMFANLDAVARRLRDGEGTLGRLTADDALYKEVDDLVRDIRQVIDNYRDTTPISTFTSLATGAF
ncbi:MAG: MCE family protein [Kiritimatiellae bacterium]|nr:MCE family protein [Kiritimatiellia bacterium]